MFKRNKLYDGTVLHGIVPLIIKKPEKKKPNKVHRKKIDANIVHEDSTLCSKFAESSRYNIGRAVLRSALIHQRRSI